MRLSLTTGHPRGVMWRQHDLYAASNTTGDPAEADLALVRERVLAAMAAHSASTMATRSSSVVLSARISCSAITRAVTSRRWMASPAPASGREAA